MSGKTFEILNTDAEDRLSASRCLTVFGNKFNPEVCKFICLLITKSADYYFSSRSIVLCCALFLKRWRSCRCHCDGGCWNANWHSLENALESQFAEKLKVNFADCAYIRLLASTGSLCMCSAFLEKFSGDINALTFDNCRYWSGLEAELMARLTTSVAITGRCHVAFV